MLVRIQIHSYRLNWSWTVKLVDSFNFKIGNFFGTIGVEKFNATFRAGCVLPGTS